MVAAKVRERGAASSSARLGGVPRAEDGTLAIMVGGETADVEEARPILACLGANIFHVGPVGSGEVASSAIT